jgi:serine/threonine-protein kinase SRPK3
MLWNLFTAPRSFTQVQFFLSHALSSDSPLALDLQAKNILLRIDDPTVLKDAEEAEIEQPSPRKITEQTIIFETSDLPGPLRRWIGEASRPVICDFGEARTGKDSYTGLIQPAVYRAPEAFLHLPWGRPVDIWNFGCMVRLIIISSFLAFSVHIGMGPYVRPAPLL